MLGTHFRSPTIASVKKVNATIEDTKANRYVLQFRPGIKKLLVFSNSAGPGVNGTQGGRIFCGSDLDGNIITSLFHWESGKVKNTCRSSTTGEILSRRDSLDGAVWLQKMWNELAQVSLPIEITIDSDSTSDNSSTTRLPKEKRNRIDLATIREGLRRGEFVLTWAPSRVSFAYRLAREAKSGKPSAAANVAFKSPVIAALRSLDSKLKGIPRLTLTQTDVSRY